MQIENIIAGAVVAGAITLGYNTIEHPRSTFPPKTMRNHEIPFPERRYKLSDYVLISDKKPRD